MQALGALLLGLIVGGLCGFLSGIRRAEWWVIQAKGLRAELERVKRIDAMLPKIYDYTTRAMREQRANLCPVEK